MSELAEFLRARRERLRPEDVGFPAGPRRRTPGLRREEVATLAGVSIDYLVRLEQGRDTNPSPSVLGALADALRLTPEEAHHLQFLGLKGNGEQCPAPPAVTHEVAPTVRTLLDQLDPTPAFVLGPFTDLLAWNEAWAAVVGPTGLLDPPRNVAAHVFTHPRARTTFPDWEAEATAQARALRAADARWHDDPVLVALLDELRGVAAFADRWAAHEVAEKRRGTKRLQHPTGGELRVAYEVLLLPDEAGHRMVTWLPADPRSASVLAALTGAATPSSPARLRVVGEA